MKTWEVTIPIAGHVLSTVEAETAEEAIQLALADASLEQVETWEALEQFHTGNICYCPRPWSAEAVCADYDDEGQQ